MHVRLIFTGSFLVQFFGDCNTNFNRIEWLEYLGISISYRIRTKEYQYGKEELLISDLFAYIGNLYYVVDLVKRNDRNRAKPFVDVLLFPGNLLRVLPKFDWRLVKLLYMLQDEEVDYIASILDNAHYLYRVLWYEVEKNGYTTTTSAEYFDTDELVTGVAQTL